MTTHIDTNDPKYPAAAAEILQRHESGQAEANITSSVRDFLIITGLAQPSEIVEENPPSDGSRSAVDLTALDTFIESKRRIGTATGGFNPNPQNVAQLDDYLRQSRDAGKGVRTGILTDGKYWLLRWPDAGPINTSPPYGFVLQPGDGWLALHNWLRDTALVALDSIPADRENVQQYLGPKSPTYQRDIDTLAALYNTHADSETIKVKRRLWYDLLRAALGEIAHDQASLDGLFIRHTYLSLVIGVAVQASFGIDIRQLAETDPSDLLQGRRFHDATGLSGIIESDFFAWPDEVGGHDLIQALARRVARFDWLHAPPDIAAILYETVIPPEERRTFGEYYTPNWLARTMVQELVTDPLNQRVLDPACGSGTFIAEAISHFLAAAASPSPPANGVTDDAENTPSPLAGEGWSESVNLDPKEIIDRLRENVIGIDVHPVAVHLARAAWALAARPAINAATAAGFDASGPVPVYLGDALQLRFRTGDMFAEHLVTIQIDDGQNSELTFTDQPGQPCRNFRCADEPGRRRNRGRAGPDDRAGRPPHRRPQRAQHGCTNHQNPAKTPRPGPRPHLGLLHPQPGATRGPVPSQGRHNRRQPALAQLQPDRRHPPHRIAPPQHRSLRHLGWRQVRHPPGRGRPLLRPLHRPLPQ